MIVNGDGATWTLTVRLDEGVDPRIRTLVNDGVNVHVAVNAHVNEKPA